ncbi:MAG: lipopolysaccharide heptosyltransferase II [Spirochaetes bacterium]|nr:lipopolysaccharide heptosyltransferase II [Spirochaetota bacterium]
MTEKRKSKIKLNVAVRMPNWIGDAVLATPFLYFLKKYLPQSRLILVMRKKVKDVFQHNPYVDKMIVIDDKKKGLFSTLKEGIKLRKLDLDLFFILPDSLSSAVHSCFSRARLKIGYRKEARSVFLNIKPDNPGRTIHRAFKYLELLEEYLVAHGNHNRASIKKDFLKNTKARIFLTKEEIKQADLILKPFPGKKIGFNPNASAVSRRWFPDRFAALADEIAKHPGNNIIFFGDKKEKVYVDRILKMMKQRGVNLAGFLSLRQYMAVLSKLDLFITNDTGPMHLANAVLTPVIAIEGAASVPETGMVNKVKSQYIIKKVDCGPCVKNECHKGLQCLDLIRVKDVLEAVRKYLQSI